MMYTDLTVSTDGLFSGYTAPEEMRSRAAMLWLRELEGSGLRALAGELNKDHRRDDGTWILGWIVGDDEHYYYVVFEPKSNRVITEKGKKAVKQKGES